MLSNTHIWHVAMERKNNNADDDGDVIHKELKVPLSN